MSTTTTTTQTSKPSQPASRPAESAILSQLTDRVRGLYTKAVNLLEAQKPDEALAVLRNQAHSDPWLRNLAAVCLLRLKRPPEALDLLRPIIWSANGLELRSDVPIVFKTNFATGLLMQGHVSAALNILHAIGNDPHPAVARLRSAIDQWKGTLSFFGRCKQALGIDPGHPISLDAVPGDLP